MTNNDLENYQKMISVMQEEMNKVFKILSEQGEKISNEFLKLAEELGEISKKIQDSLFR